MPPTHKTDPLEIASDSDLLHCISAYGDLFNDIDDNHPEGDVRHRFLGARAIRARYVEWLVRSAVRTCAGLRNDVMAGKVDPKDEGCRRTFRKVMLELDEALHWYSRVNEEDTKAAQAPVVDQYFMDEVFRYHMEQPGKGLRAPNGDLRALYGSKGDTVSASLMAPRGCEDDLIRRVVVRKLMLPFNHRVFVPAQKLYHRILGRAPGSQPQGLSGRTLEILVSALECMFAVGCVAGSVALLYSLKTTKQRLIAATFLSLIFPFPVVFFSRESVRIFTLTAGIWAVMIVFLSTANIDQKPC